MDFLNPDLAVGIFPEEYLHAELKSHELLGAFLFGAGSQQ
jgi:hypothetical protein